MLHNKSLRGVGDTLWMGTLTPMNTRTQPYSYEQLRETEPPDLDIDEVTTVSLSGHIAYDWKNSAG